MSGRDVVVTRVIDAPVARVWDAWTRPEGVMAWWGPTGFTAPLAHMDVRVGGTSHVCMRSPDGHDLHNLWTYQVVEPGRRLEYTVEFCDASGDVAPPGDLGLPADIPVPVPHVVTLTPRGERGTQVSVTEHGYTSEATRRMSEVGLEQCLDKMAASLAG